MDTFTYDKKISYRANYERWILLNSDERIQYNLKPYTKEESKEVFDKYYSKYRTLHFFW